MSSAKRPRWIRGVWGVILYNLGNKTEPCGTAASISLGVNIPFSTEALNFLWERKELISLIRLIENFNLDNLYNKTRYHVLWTAFLISKNTVAVGMLLLKFAVTWSVSLINWSVALWRPWKTNCLEFSRLLSSMCLFTILSINLANSLPVVDKRLIGLKFSGILGPYLISAT
jgi:hypothetical protein